ncbi:MAG: LysE family translocator [Pseudomonadota bacterium]
MLGIENFWLFLAAGLALNFTPGPDMLYVATRSAAGGRTAGLVSALAIGTGSIFHTAAAALGLSALVMYSAWGFELVKWVGVGYLIFLGVKAWLESRTNAPTGGSAAEPLGKIFRQGVAVNVLNPKVALFYLAFLPQFADPSSPLFTRQILFLGLVFITTGTMVNSLVGLFFGRAGQWLKKRKAARLQARLTGSMFIALGLGLALAGKD